MNTIKCYCIHFPILHVYMEGKTFFPSTIFHCSLQNRIGRGRYSGKTYGICICIVRKFKNSKICIRGGGGGLKIDFFSKNRFFFQCYYIGP